MSAPGPASGATSAERRPPVALMASVVVVVLVLDQLSKSWAVDNLAHRVVPVFWTLRFNLSFNPGLAFSQGRGFTDLITIVGVALVLGLLWWARTMTRPVLAVALALLIGGACGNLVDRLFRDHDGAVVDFIDFQWWPVFNVADIGITVGALLLVLGSIREPAPAEAAAATPSAPGPSSAERTP